MSKRLEQIRTLRQFGLSGESAGNIEDLAVEVAKRKEAKAYAGEEGDEQSSDMQAKIAELVHDAFLLGTIIGKEEADSLPDLDDEFEAIEHEVKEANEQGLYDDDEEEGEEEVEVEGEDGDELEDEDEEEEEPDREYAGVTPSANPVKPPVHPGDKMVEQLKQRARSLAKKAIPIGTPKDGKVLKPSKKNPRVRRWQRIKEVASNARKGVKEAGVLHTAATLPTRVSHAAERVAPKVTKARGVVGGVSGGILGSVGGPIGILAAGGLGAGTGLLAGTIDNAAVKGGNAAINTVYRHLSRDPRSKGQYWHEKHSWAVKSIAKKLGTDERQASRLLSQAYAYHRLSGAGVKSARKQAVGRALSKASKKEKKRARKA